MHFNCSLPAAGVAAPPLPPPLNAARGSFDLVVDESGQQASWTLQLCDVPQYIASHLHSVSSTHPGANFGGLKATWYKQLQYALQ